jgi:hypothetical protein
MKEIEIVSKIINYKSFADAANSLYCSPSLITKYVSNIEEELGIKLFVRSNKSNALLLTPEGKVLINAMCRINSTYQYLMELTKQLKRSYENIIRIGSQPRYGNMQEQDIIVSFLLNNPMAQIDMVKLIAKDLINLLQIGKLDAMFVTIHSDIKIEEYLQEQFDNSDIDIIYLSTDRDMYLGISEKYLPGKEEAKFGEFKNFTFALPFPNSSDHQETKALGTWTSLAKENGFEFKTLNFGGNDNAVFKLATMMPVAVCTTNIPLIRYDGIKFVKISDWYGCTNLYFIYLKSNKKEMVKNLKASVNQYLGSH